MTEEDCDDSNDQLLQLVSDMDCDGLVDEEDDDIDGDGVLGTEDCDDYNPFNLFTTDSSYVWEGICEDIDSYSITVGDSTIVFNKISYGDNTPLADPLGRYVLENPFYMMKTEVTQGMFYDLMGYNSYTGQSTWSPIIHGATSDGLGVGDNYPTYYSNWHMAAHFANTLSELEGEELCYTCSGNQTDVICEESMNPMIAPVIHCRQNMNGICNFEVEQL